MRVKKYPSVKLLTKGSRVRIPSGPLTVRKKMEEFDIRKHVLVPEHIKLTEQEKQELLKKFNVSVEKLPMISKKDAAIKHLEPKVGDIIKINRITKTNSENPFYRVVIHG